jgi:RES domain-containing protein
MLVYRICLAEFANELKASGNASRWNSKGNFVIYAAANRALACLENVVHRSSEGLNHLIKVMIIEIEDSVSVLDISVSSLDMNWHKRISYPYCQKIGDKWYQDGKSAVLSVPSSIMSMERNYVINCRHEDFIKEKIRLIGIEDFVFNPLIKGG